MKWTVHRLKLIFPLIHLHRPKHALAIEIQVAGGLPQANIGHMGCIEQLIAGGKVGLPPEVLDQQPHAGAAGMPENQAGTGLIFDRKQI